MKRRLILVLLLLGAFASAGAKVPGYHITKDDVSKLSPDMQDELAGLQYVLNAYQIRQFLSLADDDSRRKWVDRFWQLNDPTPTTPENEMKTEHLLRTGLARRYFPSKSWPGWDRRGEVFIRYGLPDCRGKIWGEVTLRGLNPPGEIWYYRRHDMLVSFQQSGKGDEYIYSIDPLGAAENMSPELVDFLLYDAKERLAKQIPLDLLEFYTAPKQDDTFRRLGDPSREQAYLMSKPWEIDDSIDAIMDPNIAYELPKDLSSALDKDQIRETANNFEITLEDTPTSYPFNFDRRELPFFFAVDQFRGGETTNRVEVQIEVPVSVEKGASFEETYHAEAVIWDSNFDEISREQREIVFRADPQDAQWSNLLPTQLVFSLPRGYYRLAVSVRGERSGDESSFKTSFSCEPFRPALAVSDILFARRIAQTEEASLFTRGALDVIPHPYRAYSRSFPLPVYFEIYNLATDTRGISSYKTEYRIIPQAKAKKSFVDRFKETAPVVASEFESSGYGDNDTRYVYVRTENLAKGSYDILVTITDDITKQVAYRKGSFSIID